MFPEEKKQIETLLSSDSTERLQKVALQWIANYFEEDYILDLPRSKDSLKALKDFSELKVNATLKKRAKALIKKYS